MDEDIKEAKRVLEEISNDDKEREKARLRDKYVRDMNSIRNDGYSEGFAKGEQEGFAKGEQEEKIRIAKNMLKKKIDIEIIVEMTGLTKEEIKKILSQQ